MNTAAIPCRNYIATLKLDSNHWSHYALSLSLFNTTINKHTIQLHANRFFASALSSCCTVVFGDSRANGTSSPVADRCSGRVDHICSQLRFSLITLYTTGGRVCWAWRCRTTTSASSSCKLASRLIVWNKCLSVQVRILPTYKNVKAIL